MFGLSSSDYFIFVTSILGGLFVWWLYWTTRDLLEQQKELAERIAILESSSLGNLFDSFLVSSQIPSFHRKPEESDGAEEEDTTTIEVELNKKDTE